MRESSDHHITVKGGKYLEALSEAKTIVFDKTGTLTKAQPVFREVIPREQPYQTRSQECIRHQSVRQMGGLALDRRLHFLRFFDHGNNLLITGCTALGRYADYQFSLFQYRSCIDIFL